MFIYQAVAVATLFLIPYLIVMYYLCRYNAARANSARHKMLREIAYDAAAYAFEQAAKSRKKGAVMTSDEQMAVAIHYMQKTVSVSPEAAQSAIESVLAKVSGAGASGKDKI